MEIISCQCDDTPFTAGQMSTCNYVNHRCFVDWELRLERGILGTAAVQGSVNVGFLNMHVSTCVVCDLI